MRHRLRAASAVLGTLLLAGCGTSTAPGSAYHGVAVNALSSKAAASPSSASSAASASRAVLTVRRTPLGYVLANGSGFTIYWFARDHRDSGAVGLHRPLPAGLVPGDRKTRGGQGGRPAPAAACWPGSR